ncbi:MAG: hypothetical protein AB7R55_00560 [Gemmatimonadales bacterium]
MSTFPAIALITALVGAALARSFVRLPTRRDKRRPANRVLVISGRVGGDGAAKCISGGGSGGWGTTDFLESMANTMPTTMQVLRDSGGVELTSFLGKLDSEPEPPKAVEVGTAPPSSGTS